MWTAVRKKSHANGINDSRQSAFFDNRLWKNLINYF